MLIPYNYADIAENEINSSHKTQGWKGVTVLEPGLQIEYTEIIVNRIPNWIEGEKEKE